MEIKISPSLLIKTLFLQKMSLILQEELEINSRVLGHKRGYSGTQVILRKKKTGEIVAEGRHSLFGGFRRSNM